MNYRLSSLDARQVDHALARLERACRERGLPVTVQRRAVLRALAPRGDHPSADDLFELVSRSMPGISRTTVYRVLETLVELGLASRISHPGGGARFELRRGRHHHLYCTGCGGLKDFTSHELDTMGLPSLSAHRFKVEDWSLHVTGLCADCSAHSQRKRKPRTLRS
ncbi:MAG TPA: Fur family transcriptional regulator [Myxococcota bacterium]|nr:Fur family transcriptional regulator [Myxococcota bacterium]